MGVSNNNKETISNAENMLNKLNTDNSRNKVELMSIFDTYKIKYEIQENGSIRFWYKSDKPAADLIPDVGKILR
jgi:hypothetical protein